MFDPEAIEQALFSLIESALPVAEFGFETISRRLRSPSDTTIGGQPAVYLVPMGGITVGQDQVYGQPRYHLGYVIVIYGRGDASPDQDEVPQTQLNRAWAAIDKAMAALPPGTPQTLGGLVVNAWIEGTVPMQAGILNQQTAIEIPVSVLTGI